jgi:hypothetical protein
MSCTEGNQISDKNSVSSVVIFFVITHIGMFSRDNLREDDVRAAGACYIYPEWTNLPGLAPRTLRGWNHWDLRSL